MLRVYISSISGNPNVKWKQLYVINLLTALQVPFETRDISTSEEDKIFMLETLRSQGKQVLAPQLFADEEHIGGYDELVEANESQSLSDFLRFDVHQPSMQAA